MNSNVYVFGKFGKTFTQYPDDYTRDVCIRFISEATSRSQLIIHRDNDMMYYGYVRHLDVAGQVIGFCVSMNGIMIPCIDRLYQIFEYAVSELIAGNEILTLSYDMGLTSYLESLSEKPAEVDRVAAIIQDSLLELEDEVKKLPVANIGIARNQSVRFPATESNEVIANASTQYGYTYVYKKTDFIVSNTAAVQVAPHPIPTYYVEQDDNSNNTLLYVIIALLFALVIGLGFYWYLMSNESSGSKEKVVTDTLALETDTTSTLSDMVSGNSDTESLVNEQKEKLKNQSGSDRYVPQRYIPKDDEYKSFRYEHYDDDSEYDRYVPDEDHYVPDDYSY